MKRPSDRRLGCLIVTLVYATAIAASIWLMTVMTGCTRTVYVPTESVRTEWRDHETERTVTDTVRDTRLVWMRGDTVLDIRDRWHRSTEYVHDTCYIERTDTLREPYPVERPLTRWERTKMDLGGVALGVIVAILCAAVAWLALRIRRKH